MGSATRKSMVVRMSAPDTTEVATRGHGAGGRDGT